MRCVGRFPGMPGGGCSVHGKSVGDSIPLNMSGKKSANWRIPEFQGI